MPAPLCYRTGEEIRAGDRVLMDEHHSGIVEFIANDQNDPEYGWYVREHGIGVMVNTSEFGSVYTGATDDLDLVARNESETKP